MAKAKVEKTGNGVKITFGLEKKVEKTSIKEEKKTFTQKLKNLFKK